MSTVIIDDSFQRANTSIGVIGPPDSFTAPGTGAAWINPNGGGWQVVGNQAKWVAGSGGGTSGVYNRIVRPYAEAQLNQEIELTVAPSPTGGNREAYYLLARQKADGTGIFGLFEFFSDGTCGIGFGYHGNDAQAGLSGNGVLAAPVGTPYTIRLKVSGAAGGEASIIAELVDKVTGNLIGSFSTITTGAGIAAIRQAGTVGWGAQASYSDLRPNTIIRARASYTSDSNLNTPTTTLKTSTTGNSVILNGTGTNWMTSNPTFTATGVTGTSIVSRKIINNVTALVTITTGATTGTLTLTDPSQSSANTATLVVSGTAAAMVIAGQPYNVPVGNSTDIKMLVPPPANGTGPFTYAGYRVNVRTKGASFNATTEGAATETLAVDAVTGYMAMTNTPPDGKHYTYKVIITDAAATTITTEAVVGIRGYIDPPTLAPNRLSAVSDIRFGQIGDSFLGYVTTATPPSLYEYTNALLVAAGAGAVHAVNLGYGGKTIKDFDPTETGNLWTGGGANFQATNNTNASTFATATFCTNDANAAESKSQYKTSFLNLANQLVTDRGAGHRLILHYPTWLANNINGNDLAFQYADACRELITENPTKFTAGDPYYFVWSSGASRTAGYNGGLHPEAAQMVPEAKYFAYAIANTYPAPDTTAPTVASATINTAGTLLTLTFTETDSPPILPSSGITGFTLSGGHTLTNGTRTSATTATFPVSPVVYGSETITLSYAGGNLTDSAPTPNALATIIGASTTNNSTQVIPTVATPTFDPTTGTYTEAQSVTIASATGGATIHFTTDGSTPTTSSPTYSTPVSVGVSKTIKALAVKAGMTDSAIGTAVYTITPTPSTGGTIVYVATPLRIVGADGKAPGPANNARYDYYQGDSAPAQEISLIDASGTPLNIAGATVEYKMRQRVGGYKQVVGVGEIAYGAGGAARYALTSDNLDTVGVFAVTWRFTLSDGSVITIGGIIVEVKAY